ncbi:hypothetical protein HMPREF0645_1955 [Hallella bergensis DSM 17361]|uniref:Sulfate transporter n=1 Tax=Hallella bergensis DSM 17361 TaxID=585502 RepID=D1PYC0_9BACT|nr:hypothetical protein HMPREF0645_1955 [Hallella bergensis DSM 17361]
MNTGFTYYLFILAAIVVGIVILKKITSCLFRIICLAVIVAVLAYIYFVYFQ